MGCHGGVGTRVLIACARKRLSTVGIVLVAMNVNDLITTGAEPLFFLDYLAVHKLEPAALGDVIEGVAAGCLEVYLGALWCRWKMATSGPIAET